uniref:Uncharacterized protein n=1 Tax=Polynucleobacter necessarius subsp. necessarius (strain STIR1) TaxID=452638 RepID=B1XUH8_POLNS
MSGIVNVYSLGASGPKYAILKTLGLSRAMLKQKNSER